MYAFSKLVVKLWVACFCCRAQGSQAVDRFLVAAQRSKTFLMPAQSNTQAGSPGSVPSLIIAGVGGSGTRGVADLMENLGLHMCEYVNAAQDNLDTDPSEHPGIKEKLKRLLHVGGHRISVEAYQQDPATFKELVAWQKQQVERTRMCSIWQMNEDGIWGFKNPQQLYLWPMSQYAYGNQSRLLLVVRDPRDVCSSHNHHQFNDYCESVLGRTCVGESDCFSFWAKVHSELLDGKAAQGTLTFVRIEDLSVPEPSVARARVECMLSSAGMAKAAGFSSYLNSFLNIPDKIETALRPVHAHSTSYMGQHYGASDEERHRLIKLTSEHKDALVRKTMLRLGYSPEAFALSKPQEAVFC